MIDNNSKTICTHIKHLTKKTLQNLTSSILQNKCLSCAQIIVQNKKCVVGQEGRVCLHCCGLLCSGACFKQHAGQQKTGHIFSCDIRGVIQGEHFRTYCEKCNGRMLQDYDKQLITEQNANLQFQKQLNRFIAYLHTEILPVLSKTIKEFIQNYEEQSNLYMEEDDYQKDICGLFNLGNTCYMNTVIQALFNIKSLRDYYLQTKWGTIQTTLPQSLRPSKQLQFFYDDMIEKEEQNRWHVVTQKTTKKQNRYDSGIYINKAVMKSTRFNEQFSNLMKILSKQEHCIEPVEFLLKLGEIDEKYKKNCEQDAEELLYMVLDCLSQGELLKVSNLERYEKVEKILGRQKLTKTQKVFASYYANQIICEKCHQESWKIDLTYGLSTPINPPPSHTIQHPHILQPIQNILYYKPLFYPHKPSPHKFYPHFFEFIFSEEKLTYKNNYWTCEKCEGIQAKKRTYMIEEPETLIVTFKRFDHRNIGMKKNQWVEFGEIIDISSFCLRSEEEMQGEDIKRGKYYRVIGVIVHEGSQLNTGHYICFIKKGRQWYKCSDDKIQITTWNQVRNSQAYILFYKKITHNL